MELVEARFSDIPTAVDCLVQAFAHDELVQYFFPGEPDSRMAGTREFFTILMTVRVELGMPAIILKDDGMIVGAVMGYDTNRPEWSKAQSDRWDAFTGSRGGLSERLDTYTQVAKRFEPREPHFYLGVLGVHPDRQGMGAGRILVDAYCRHSDADPSSTGTYLETVGEKNVRFYKRCGFDVAGSAMMDDGVMLHCLFRRKQEAASIS